MAGESERKSYQFRALTRKTLAYQKRQLFTNICCVGCCPFLMVLICGVLTFVVGALINKLNEVEYYRYCARENSSFLDPVTEAFMIKDETKERKLVNFSPRGSCVLWFGEVYPQQFPYSPPVTDNCSAAFNPELCPLDASSAVPPPANGWLSHLTPDPETALALSGLLSKQLNFHSLVATLQGKDYGTKGKSNKISLFPPYGTFEPPVSTGLLGNFSHGFYTQNTVEDFFEGKAEFSTRPYFDQVASPEELNNKLFEIIKDVSAKLSLISLNTTEDQEELTKLAAEAQEILSTLPFGGMILENIDENNLDYTVQVGTNRRLNFLSLDKMVNGDKANLTSNYAAFPTEGIRRLLHTTRMTQAYLKSMSPFREQNVTISQGIRMFPSDESTEFSLPIGSFVGEILYPFGVSFLLPVFVVTIVKEKEDRILIMMRMNGMKTWVYWASMYIHFYILHILASSIFVIFGNVLRLEFFTLSDPGAYVLLFFIWGHVQIAMSFFLSTLFNKSRVALMLTFCLVLAGVVINVTLSFFLGDGAPIGYLVYPPFAFYRALSIVNRRAFIAAIPAYTMGMMVPGDPLFDCVIALVIETLLLFLLTMYATAVMPSEYGIQRPWHFVVTDAVKWARKRNDKKEEKKFKTEEQVKINIDREEDHVGEDEDVQAERARIRAGEFPEDSPVVVQDMKKVYPNGKLAVKSVSLAIEDNSVFGLLGPNGAGKTTLISILTGLYPPSAGNAWLAGYNVNTDMQEIYMNIGVCPQHDILWDDLTVEEHLLFYARIKGIPPKEEKEAVQKAMETVSLQKFKHRLSKGLSGGEKRRLSIAISLTGNGKVVFLDEPTTGLDPEVRRLIWDIIQTAKSGRTIILTTHSMEEAEVLCQRIGIMAKGNLRCLGPQVRLKKKYGRGFKISISCDAQDHPRACQFVESVLPLGWKKVDDFVGNTSYEFDCQEIAPIFDKIGKHKEEYGIQFWGISQTSLEEVFLKIINEADAEAS